MRSTTAGDTGYYIERSLLTPGAARESKASNQSNGSEDGLQFKGWRLPAHEIEKLVLTRLCGFLRDRGALLKALPLARKSPDVVSAIFTRAEKLAEMCDAGSVADQVVAAHVQRIIVAQDRVAIEVDRKALAARLLNQDAVPASKAKKRGAFTIDVPVRFRRRGVEAKLVVLDPQHPASEPDPNLIKALARAHEWFGQIVRGEADGVGAIARVERLDRAYVTRLVCLAFLAPDITKAILEGRQPPELTAKLLISFALKVPLLWTEQAGANQLEQQG